MAEQTDFVRCANIDDLAPNEIHATNINGQPIALILNESKVRAIDNRCPHMGYPLSRGTVDNGILICHWHHARFDLASGCTFDPWADDVEAFPVEVRDREIFVNVRSNGQNRIERWKKRLREGMEQNINLIRAKAIIALRDLGVDVNQISEIGALFGVNGRRGGWGSGMTILTAMTNIADRLEAPDQILALYQGLRHVSNETSNSPPRNFLEPLETDEHSFDRLREWFKYFIEVRNADGAERTLSTAIKIGANVEQISEMMISAATDHFYRSGGHTLDFTNKGFELLDLIGWENADRVLPTLVGGLASSSRSEEQNRWWSPINLVTPIKKASADLKQLFAEGEGKTWDAGKQLSETILGEDPLATIEAIKTAISSGAKITQLTQTLAYSASLRIARFHVKNEIGDWIAVLHTFTYANALHQSAKRSPSIDLVRGVFHGAMSIYFDRWFNMPAARLPQDRRDTQKLPIDPEQLLNGFVDLLNTQGMVDQAGMYVYRYLSLGHPREKMLAKLGHTLLREDADFHTFQMTEAAFRLADELDEERAINTLVAAGRYIAGHAPTDRALRQTANFALRLHRGEDLSADDPDEVVED